MFSAAQDCELTLSAIKAFGENSLTNSPYYLVSSIQHEIEFNIYGPRLADVRTTIEDLTDLTKSDLDSLGAMSRARWRSDQLSNCRGTELVVLSKHQQDRLLRRNSALQPDELVKMPWHIFRFYQLSYPITIKDYALIQVTEVIKSKWTHTKGLLFKRDGQQWKFLKEIYSWAS